MVRGSRSRAQESDRGAIVSPARRRRPGRAARAVGRPLPAAARRRACSAPRPRQQLATISISMTLPPQADRTFGMRVGVCGWEASAPQNEMQLPVPNFKKALYPTPQCCGSPKTTSASQGIVTLVLMLCYEARYQFISAVASSQQSVWIRAWFW